MTCITRFTFNASLRCRAPSSPILLPHRCSAVSVCEERRSWRCDTLYENWVTWFTFKTSTTCRTPSGPMLFDQIWSVVSVCVERRSWRCDTLYENCITWFIFNTSAICLTPLGPVLFDGRWSVMSVLKSVEYGGMVQVSKCMSMESKWCFHGKTENSCGILTGVI